MGIGELDGKQIKVESHEERPDQIEIKFLGQQRRIKGTIFFRCDLRTGKIDEPPTQEQHELSLAMNDVKTVHKLQHTNNYIYTQAINLKNAHKKFTKQLYPNNHKEMHQNAKELEGQKEVGERIVALENKYLGQVDPDTIPPEDLRVIDEYIYELAKNHNSEMENSLVEMIKNLNL